MDKSALPQMGLPVPLSDYERGWLECLVDGEGCLYFGVRYERERLRSWRAALHIGNKSRPFLEKAMKICGAGSIYGYRAKGNRKHAWQYVLYGETLRSLLPQLDLIVKREQKTLLMKALQITDNRNAGFRRPYSPELQKELLGLAVECRKLNQRGQKPKLQRLAEVASRERKGEVILAED